MANKNRHKIVAVFIIFSASSCSISLVFFPSFLLISCCSMPSWNPKTAHQMRLQAYLRQPLTRMRQKCCKKQKQLEIKGSKRKQRRLITENAQNVMLFLKARAQLLLGSGIFKGGELNPGERHSRDARDDGTVALCTLRAATVLSRDCRADFGRSLTKQVMSHSRDGRGVTAPLRTNIVPLTGVWNPPPLPLPPLKGPQLEVPRVRLRTSGVESGTSPETPWKRSQSKFCPKTSFRIVLPPVRLVPFPFSEGPPVV